MRGRDKYKAASSLPRKARKKRPRTTSFLRVLFRRVVLALFFFVLGSCCGLAAVFYYLSLDLPQIGPLLEGYDPPQTTRILAADDTVIGEIYEERRTLVPIEDIPDVMKNAVIAAEDADFRNHEGLDYMGMARAMLTNVTSGRLAQGASTITQQVARTFFLSREKTFTRKFKEMLLTKRIEERLTKDEILYLYLSQINFGHARYGVAEAAGFYFDKEIGDISIDEAALLAAIPKGPSIYEPIGHPKKALERRSYVITEMEKHSFISASEAQLAKTAPIELAGTRRHDSTFAPEAVALALRNLAGIVSTKQLRHGGYTIKTTIDPMLQAAARDALRQGLSQTDTRHKRVAPYKNKKWLKGDRGKRGALQEGRTYVARVTGTNDTDGTLALDLAGRRGVVRLSRESRYNPNNLPPSSFAVKGAKLRVSIVGSVKASPLSLRVAMGAQGALVSIDPTTGSVEALVGGYEMSAGGFDRSTRSVRQPGSAFKPLVYLEALRSRRYTPATLLDDSPEVDGEWRPQNSHGDKYLGEVPLRKALADSMNLPAVKLIRDVGPGKVAALAKALGIASHLDEGPALALGSSAVTPFEMAAAYAVLANRGHKIKPWIVDSVITPDNRKIPLMGRASTTVITEQEAYMITSLLQSVVENGTGKKARSLGHPVAGKTGTSNNSVDAWFVGYTRRLATSVWVGFDAHRSIGRKEYGARAALPIWVDFMKQAHKGHKKLPFERPPGIVDVSIDPATGLLAYEEMEGAVTELFIEGTEPSQTATPPDLIDLDDFMAAQAAGEFYESDAGTTSDSDGGTTIDAGGQQDSILITREVAGQ